MRRRSKKTSKLRVPGLCAGNSPVTGEFPAQRASKAENVSIWWSHHEKSEFQKARDCFVIIYALIKFADLERVMIIWAWIINYIHLNMGGDYLSMPNFIGGLAKEPLKLGNGWLVIFHRKLYYTIIRCCLHTGTFVPEAGINGRASNYITQYLWDGITCPCPWYLLLVHKSSYILIQDKWQIISVMIAYSESFEWTNAFVFKLVKRIAPMKVNIRLSTIVFSANTHYTPTHPFMFCIAVFCWCGKWLWKSSI